MSLSFRSVVMDITDIKVPFDSLPKTESCDSYHIRESSNGFVPICWGTKEMEECRCYGDRTECTFYPEVRKRAKAAALFHEVYQFFEPHFSGDDKELMDYIAKAIEAYKEVQ